MTSRLATFHGTSAAVARGIAGSKRGAVDVTRGGGELGRGFYTGEHLYEAKAWAFHRDGDKQGNVVEFATEEGAFFALDVLSLDAGEAGRLRQRLRQAATSRTHRAGVDVIWAPIVGSDRVTGQQYKWESASAQSVLNGQQTVRRVR